MLKAGRYRRPAAGAEHAGSRALVAEQRTQFISALNDGGDAARPADPTWQSTISTASMGVAQPASGARDEQAFSTDRIAGSSIPAPISEPQELELRLLEFAQDVESAILMPSASRHKGQPSWPAIPSCA